MLPILVMSCFVLYAGIAAAFFFESWFGSYLVVHCVDIDICSPLIRWYKHIFLIVSYLEGVMFGRRAACGAEGYKTKCVTKIVTKWPHRQARPPSHPWCPPLVKLLLGYLGRVLPVDDYGLQSAKKWCSATISATLSTTSSTSTPPWTCLGRS